MDILIFISLISYIICLIYTYQQIHKCCKHGNIDENCLDCIYDRNERIGFDMENK